MYVKVSVISCYLVSSYVASISWIYTLGTGEVSQLVKMLTLQTWKFDIQNPLKRVGCALIINLTAMESEPGRYLRLSTQSILLACWVPSQWRNSFSKIRGESTLRVTTNNGDIQAQAVTYDHGSVVLLEPVSGLMFMAHGTTKGHMDTWGLGCNLRPCLCLKGVPLSKPRWSGRPVLLLGQWCHPGLGGCRGPCLGPWSSSSQGLGWCP